MCTYIYRRYIYKYIYRREREREREGEREGRREKVKNRYRYHNYTYYIIYIYIHNLSPEFIRCSYDIFILPVQWQLPPPLLEVRIPKIAMTASHPFHK